MKDVVMTIDTIVVQGYRLLRDVTFKVNKGMNILVGDNESGKSTLLEAIALALTCKVNGRWAKEELNPFWFNTNIIAEYFAGLLRGEALTAPIIRIELYLTSDDDDLHRLRGPYNSLDRDCPGLSLRIVPDPDFAQEFASYLAAPDRPDILPIEYYDVEWFDFADQRLTRRPPGLGVSVIDSRTVKSTSGVDYHTREMLSDYIAPEERARISIAHRNSRVTVSNTALSTVNERIAAQGDALHDRPLGLQMDQSSNASWESSVVPLVADIPFAMAGQGQQAAIKVALAMNRHSENYAFALVEEPENHLSHTGLTKLISRIETLAGSRQVFVTTHSSFVLNRLGLDKLLLLHKGKHASFSDLSPSTVRYFRRLSGYDTLRLVVANRVVLVEGPSDEMLFERCYRDIYGKIPIDDGIDIVSLRGVALRRSLEVCAALDRRVAAVRDNDGKQKAHWEASYAPNLTDERRLFVGDPVDGRTLEPQVLAVNDLDSIRTMLNLTAGDDVAEWMRSHKTDASLYISDAPTSITYPTYITDAISFIHE